MPDMEVDFPRGGNLAPVVSTKHVQKKRKKQEEVTKETVTILIHLYINRAFLESKEKPHRSRI
jgi:hypothetical protein